MQAVGQPLNGKALAAQFGSFIAHASRRQFLDLCLLSGFPRQTVLIASVSKSWQHRVLFAPAGTARGQGRSGMVENAVAWKAATRRISWAG